MNFGNSERLLLLLIIPLLLAVYYYGLKRKERVAVKFANLETLKKITSHGRPFQKNYIVVFLRVFAIALLIVALARPQAEIQVETTKSDVILAIDVSGSMRAVDYQPNRLEAAKEAALVFVRELKRGDRVGVVVFSGVSRIILPLSDNLEEVEGSIKAIDFGVEDGTAIGDGLITSASLLSGSEGRKKFVVLLSDGQNNRGVAPQDAALYAKSLNIKVYTVGIGSSEGFVPGSLMVTGLDEETLKEIAASTGGEYRLARSEQDLKGIYKKIARSIGIEVKQKDISEYFIFLSLLLLSLDFALAATRFRTLP